MKRLIILMSIIPLLGLKPPEHSSFYYVIVTQTKIKSWCKTDTDYSIHQIPKNVNYTVRNKMLEVLKKRALKDDNTIIRNTYSFNISPTDYLVVYQYIVRNDECPSKQYKFISAFIASSEEEINKKMAIKLKTSFVSERIISHKILYQKQALNSTSEPSLLNEFKQLIKDLDKDKPKKEKKSTAIGVRG